ncbi:GntR family transcriptional regulator [Nocardia testacea]|uniref:GntR family transcriptional regulator n=1 Tax=Nocardia testacea TaxID=248551 RepID=A0ABW7VPX8_9NOCA
MARDSKADQVYSVLREEILTGQSRPGESLSVLKMADRFGASRTPVRDAFLRLESDGLVSLIDRQGARVAPISVRGVRELFEIRIILEGSASKQVAEAAAHDHEIRSAFTEFAEKFRAIAREEPSPRRRDRFYALTEAFDQAVIARTRNQRLSRMIADLRPHSARLRILAHAWPDRMDASLPEHLAMCEAIVNSDPDAAASACAAHLINTQKIILAAVLESDSMSVPVDIVGP